MSKYNVDVINYMVHIGKYTLHVSKYTLHVIKYIVHIIKYMVHIGKYSVHVSKYTLHVVSNFHGKHRVGLEAYSVHEIFTASTGSDFRHTQYTEFSAKA